MKIKELENYYFHDSSILNIEKKDNTILVKILFCLFMQDNYDENNAENCILELTFKEASIKPSLSIDENTILDTIINENSIQFNLELDDTGIYQQYTITASSVEVKKINI